MSRNFELLAQFDTRPEKQPMHGLPFTLGSAEREKTAGHVGSAFTEEMLRLVQRVFLSANGSAPRQLVFCGVDGGKGSTAVCAGAARALAATTSQSVCLIDANTCSHGLSRAVGLSETSLIFRDRASMREGCVQVEGNLWFDGIDAGADKTGSLADIDKLKDRLTRLQRSFDFVLIDAPGTNLSEDAAMIVRYAGATIFVIDAHRTRRVTALRAMETLEAASGVTVLGTVLHDRTFPIPGWVYKRL